MRLYTSIFVALGLSISACGKKAPEPQKTNEPTAVETGKKPEGDKPADKTGDKPADQANADKPGDKPATDKPADQANTDKPATDKPADQANADKPATAPADHAAAVQAAFEALSNGKIEEAYANYADDATMTMVGFGGATKGKAAIVDQERASLKAFPDAKFKAARIIDTADATVVQYVMQGTNSGELMGKPATNKKLSVGGVLVIKHNADGKVASVDQFVDGAAVLQQLGVFPGQKPEDAVTLAAWPETTEVVKGDAVAANVDLIKGFVGKFKADTIEAAVKETFADDYVALDPNGGPAENGKDAAVTNLSAVFKAMPDFASTVDAAYGAGEYVVATLTANFTYAGGIAGVEAKGQKLTTHMLGVAHVVNGKVASWTSYENQLELLGQLGVLGGAADKPADGAAPAADGAAPAGELAKFGVVSCDAYLAHMQECIGAMPEAARASVQDAMKQVLDGWKQVAAGGDAAKAGMEQACKTALDAAKQSMGAICPNVKWE